MHTICRKRNLCKKSEHKIKIYVIDNCISFQTAVVIRNVWCFSNHNYHD